jgi:hypothetical protein
MNYLDTLRPEAERTIRPLADRVATLTRELERLRAQAATEAGNVVGLTERLQELKGAVGSYAAGGQNSFTTFKSKLARVMGSAPDIVPPLSG